MLRLTPTEPEWSPLNADELAAFLASKTGQQFLARLLYLRPGFSASSDTNKRLIESGVIEGYEAALAEIQRATIRFEK